MISIELFMDVDATAHIVLFRICVWFLGCWTPTIDLDFSMKLDKVVFISAFGGPDGWGDADGSFGAVMFCDRSTGFPNYGPHRKDVSSMATNFKPGEGLSVHPHSEININLLGLVHLRFGIPNLNC